MNQDYTQLEKELKELIYGLKNIFTLSEIFEVEQFIDAGEYGVAFETLCAIAKEEKLIIPVELRPLIRSLAKRMEIESCWWAEIV